VVIGYVERLLKNPVIEKIVDKKVKNPPKENFLDK